MFDYSELAFAFDCGELAFAFDYSELMFAVFLVNFSDFSSDGVASYPCEALHELARGPEDGLARYSASIWRTCCPYSMI